MSQSFIKPTETIYALRLSVSGSITYVGEASPGSLESASVWRIKKIDESSGISVTWADGNTYYDNVWNDRSGLSYS